MMTGLWYTEEYPETNIADILSNFAFTLRIYPNVFSMELLAYPSKVC